MTWIWPLLRAFLWLKVCFNVLHAISLFFLLFYIILLDSELILILCLQMTLIWLFLSLFIWSQVCFGVVLIVFIILNYFASLLGPASFFNFQNDSIDEVGFGEFNFIVIFLFLTLLFFKKLDQLSNNVSNVIPFLSC